MNVADNRFYREPEPRPDPTTAIIAAIRSAFSCDLHLEAIKTRAWSSVSFRGARHELTFRVEGGVLAETEAFLAALDARAFALTGHLVADITVTASQRYPGFASISLEAITVEE